MTTECGKTEDITEPTTTLARTMNSTTQSAQRAIDRQAAWMGFNTFSDPILEGMVGCAVGFIRHVECDERPRRWLTLLGKSGTGKTHIARQIWRWWMNSSARRRVGVNESAGCILNGRFLEWAEIASEIRREPNGDLMLDLAREELLIVDDIGAVADNTGFITSELVTLAIRRMGLWTVFTSNLTIDAIQTKIDERVASRMGRGHNKFITINTIDYDLRNRG